MFGIGRKREQSPLDRPVWPPRQRLCAARISLGDGEFKKPRAVARLLLHECAKSVQNREKSTISLLFAVFAYTLCCTLNMLPCNSNVFQLQFGAEKIESSLFSHDWLCTACVCVLHRIVGHACETKSREFLPLAPPAFAPTHVAT
jgi:hypothetical protein